MSTSSTRSAQQINPAINLQAQTLIGSDSSCDQRLGHPLVAPKHARITLQNGQARLQDLGSGTFVNSNRVVGKTVTITPGDQIDIGPYVFTFTGARLEAYSSMSHAQISVLGLSRKVTAKGREISLFENIALVFRPGDFVCLMGPSGSGKSSLLNCLSGRTEPTSGTVQVNSRDLYANFESLKQHMVVVAQEPLTHSALTIDQAMRFTASLRLPLKSKPKQRVESLLQDLNLNPIRKQRISTVSGGQKKRFCLANELISDPGLLFLDEVTSGLDEYTDEEIMELFRGLAQQRKTIVCVTHSLANVAKKCNQVVVLAQGGLLAFVGTPAEALQYFQVSSLAEIYPRLVKTELDPDAPRRVSMQFLNSEHYRRYLAERLPEDQRLSVNDIENSRKQKSKSPAKVNWLGESVVTAWQSCVLAIRQGLLLAKDRWHWLSLISQVFLIAMVLYLAFEALGAMPAKPRFEDATLGVASSSKEENKNEENKNDETKNRDTKSKDTKNKSGDGQKNDDAPQGRPVGFLEGTMKRMDWLRQVLNFTFLVGVTSFWLGCNNAAREIVRERAIYQHEYNFNLRPLAYFLSKLLVLTVLVFCQVLLLAQLAWYFCGPPDALSSYFYVLICLAFCGTTLGLMVSAISKTESVAVSLIPIAVIPQIILSGAITKIDGLGKVLSQLSVSNYWGRTWMDACITGEASEFGLNENIDMLQPASMAGLPLMVILVHSILFCAVTLLSLYNYNPIPRLSWSQQK